MSVINVAGHPFPSGKGILAWVNRAIIKIDWLSVAAFGLPMVLYLLTMAPTIYNLDSAELTTAVSANGIIRATGYPLYLVLGKVWSWLPVGDVGYRMNLFSAACGATTIFLADRILRQLQVGSWARFGALGLLATALYFWALSLIAEVYTLHTALMAGVILLLIRFAQKPTPINLALPVFLMALSMGNHAATVLLIPGCVWYVVVTHPRRLLHPQMLVASLVGLLLGATVFLILPIRYAANPAFNYAGHYDATGQFVPVNLQTLDGILWLITGRTFSGQMFGYSWGDMWLEAQTYGSHLWTAFFAIGIGPGLLGVFTLLRRDWRVGIMLALMFLANAIFYINYRVIDKATMYLPTYVLWAIWAGMGYQVLLNWLQSEQDAPGKLVWLTRGLLVGGVVLALVWNWPLVDLSNDWSTRQQSEQILRDAEPNAIILGWWDTVPGIQYLQLVEGQRPDVLVINRFLISGEDMNQLILNEIGKRPIYINNPSVELLQVANATVIGPMYRLELRQITLP